MRAASLYPSDLYVLFMISTIGSYWTYVKKFDKKGDLLDEDAEARFVLDEYNSDDENGPQPIGHTGTGKQEGLSASSMNLMEKLVSWSWIWVPRVIRWCNG